jgi:chemotaxis protein methyltransferase CheR
MKFGNVTASAAETAAAVDKVSKIVSELSGIQLGAKQLSMVENRLQNRMMTLQITNTAEYLEFLNQNFQEESLALVSLMTTHYTYFFREFNHFEFLLNKTLLQHIEVARRRADKTIHIWSAACSSGEEGYSLALFYTFHLAEMAPDIKFKIYGTDIDPESVQKAQNGVYKNEELTQSPVMYIQNQFVKGQGSAEGYSKVKKNIKENCNFEVYNIFECHKFQPSIEFDVIFCRNVFIYFDQNQVKEISAKLIKRLSPQGFLFTGISESLTRLGLDITTLATSVYQHKSAVAPSKQVLVKPEKTIERPIEVLCVDDSGTILNLMKRILTVDKGFVVKATAKNGREALEILQKQKFDAITLDLHMPEVDGIEFLKRFDRQTPVIVVSSVNRDDMTLAQTAISLGAADYVEKPSLDNIAQGGNEICSKVKMVTRSFKKPVSSQQSPAAIPREKTSTNSKPLAAVSAKSTSPVLKVAKPQSVQFSDPSIASKKVKVLIVDDSQTVVHLLSKMISTHPQIEVVAQTTKPLEVEGLIQNFRPDVITMDIHMPDLDGLTLLRIINSKYHIPTIMISSMNKEDSELVIKALELGAIDFIQKPNMAQVQEMTITTCERILMAANANLKTNSVNLKELDRDNFRNMNRKIVLIGASTGGTEALRELLQKLPPQIPPILIVQHIPEFFSASLAKHLNDLFPFTVKEAANNDIVKPNQVLIAPGGMQMSINSRRGEYFVEIKNDPPVNRHKPSVDYMFKSATENKIPAENLVAVILTGMGADGALEMKRLHQRGVKTIAQNEESCVVFGMPKEAIKLGAIDHVLPLKDIGEKIIQLSVESVKSSKKAS